MMKQSIGVIINIIYVDVVFQLNPRLWFHELVLFAFGECRNRSGGSRGTEK